MIRSVAPRLLALVGVLALALSATPVSTAAQPDTPELTWSVQPADERGPDGRRWVEHTFDPGQVVTEYLAVRNFADRPAQFALKAADGYFTDKGRFTMLSSGKPSVDGGTWVRVAETVTVASNATAVVPFTISVPLDARPGDHPAGIAATVTATGGPVAVESRVGFRVMMRVSGTVAAEVAVEDLAADFHQSWNPFSPGSVDISYTAVNTGSVGVTGTTRVTADELFGAIGHTASAELGRTLLPGDARPVQVRVGAVWGLGPVQTTVDITPTVAGDTSGVEIRPTTVTITVWVIPWPQLIVLVLLIALGLGIRAIVRRRRRVIADLVARARDEGRADALANSGD